MDHPLNAAAIEIVRLRSVNKDIDTQIKQLRDIQIAHAETSGNLSHVATWETVEVPEPDPDTEPEQTPPPGPGPNPDPDPGTEV